ncbi:unnamed protein product, partial [marine sediment metagenome]
MNYLYASFEELLRLNLSLRQMRVVFYNILLFILFTQGRMISSTAQENTKGSQRSRAPVVAGQIKYRANLVTFPDGTWEVFTARDYNGVFRLDRMRSVDDGQTWSAPEVLRDLPGDGWAGAVSLLDSDSEVHLIFSRWRHKE